MKFFERITGKDKQRSGWENMQPSYDKERLNAERQQRKLLAMYSGAREIKDILRETDVEVSPNARESIIDMLAHDEVDERIKRNILNVIEGPADRNNGPDGVATGLNSDFERRILAVMSRGSLDAVNNLNGSDVRAFLSRFPSPIDFESSANMLIESISKDDQDLGGRYAFSMEIFQKKIYGKKYEYWQQMKALDAEADNHLEREWNHEWAPGSSGYCQASEQQVVAGMVNRSNLESGMEADDSCADSLYYNPARQLYAAFDGVGRNNSKAASSLAVETLEVTSDAYPDMRNCSSLSSVLNAVDMNVSRLPRGETTGVIAAPIDFNGRKMLSYASVGNSSIFIVDKNGNARKVTSDNEGVGLFLNNSLGAGRKDGNHFRCSDFGQVDIDDKSIVVVITDGINSGYKEEGLSTDEIGRIARRSRGPQAASRRLVECARSQDDRSAIVFVPDFSRL